MQPGECGRNRACVLLLDEKSIALVLNQGGNPASSCRDDRNVRGECLQDRGRGSFARARHVHRGQDESVGGAKDQRYAIVNYRTDYAETVCVERFQALVERSVAEDGDDHALRQHRSSRGKYIKTFGRLKAPDIYSEKVVIAYTDFSTQRRAALLRAFVLDKVHTTVLYEDLRGRDTKAGQFVSYHGTHDDETPHVRCDASQHSPHQPIRAERRVDRGDQRTSEQRG